MPSNFDAMFIKTATPLLDEYFGECITYTPLGGVAKKISAIIERGEGGRQDPSLDGIVLRTIDTLKVLTAECTHLQLGDVFTFDGRDFRLEHVPKRYESGWATILAEDMRYLEKSDGGVQRVGK